MSRGPSIAEDTKRRLIEFGALLESYVASWRAENIARVAPAKVAVARRPTTDPQQPGVEHGRSGRAASGR